MKPGITVKSNKSLILKAISGLVVASLLGIFFLPAILSNNWVGNAFEKAVNEKSPGKLHFDTISFSWVNGLSVQRIVYENQLEGITFKAKEIASEKGLLALATNYTDIGQITITDPVTYIHQQNDTTPSATASIQDQNTDASKETNSSTQKSPSRASQKTEPADSANIIPPFDGKLVISGGSIILMSADKQEKVVVTALDLQATLISLTNSLEYHVRFLDKDGSGKVEGGGTLTLPRTANSTFNQLQTEVDLHIEKWEIGDLLTILARDMDVPTGNGTVSSHLNIAGSIDNSLDITGNMDASNIHLKGGPFKSDTPSFEKIALEIDIQKTSSALKINTFALTSPLVTGTISGGIGTDDSNEISGGATLDLAKIFNAFPDTLNLQEGIEVSDGKIQIKVDLNGTKNATSFDVSAQLKRLQGIAAKKKISWDQPITVEIQGVQGQKELKIENFEAKSSFLHAQGQGDSDQMQLNLTSNIGAALKELKKFIRLDDWKSSGQMAVDLEVSRKAEGIFPANGEFDIKDFTLQYKNSIVAPKKSLAVNVNTIIHVDKSIRPMKITSTALDFQTWLGNGSGTMQTVELPTKNDSLSLENVGLLASLDLAQLSTMLQSLEILPVETRLAGLTDLATKFSFKNSILDLNELKIDANDFQLRKNKQHLRDKNIKLTAHGSADLQNKSVNFQSVTLKTTAGHIALPKLIVTDWSQLQNTIKTNGTADVELSALTSLLTDFIEIPDETKVSGQTALKLAIDLTKINEQSIQISGSMRPLTIHSKGKLVSEDPVDFTAVIEGNGQSQNYSLKKLNFSASPFSFNATGEVTTKGKDKLLSTEGSIDLNLVPFSKQLQSLLGLALEMTGTSTNPFVVKTRSTDGLWNSVQKHTDISTTFSAETITGHGLQIEALKIPVKLEGGIGTIDVQGKVNNGEMVIQPTVDFNIEPAILSLPDNANLLTGVKLTEDMSEDIMAKVHPLFKGAAITKGTVDLTMQNFSWPLDKEALNHAAFTGSFMFHDVKLQASGILAPLLALMKVDEQEITLSDEPMTFVGANERITCSPLEILTKNYSLIVSGSVGFDQSLDYIAKIPVTTKMVGKNAFKYLEGTFIHVPVGGTVSKPKVSKNIVQDALKDLMKQAGKKEITNQAGKLLQKLFQ